MTISSCCTSYNGACPEVVPLTIVDTDNNYSVNEATITSATVLSVGSPPQRATVTLQMKATDGVTNLAQQMQFTARLVESLSDKSTPAPISPDGLGWSEKDLITDANGNYVLQIDETGIRTWYLVIIFGGFVHDVTTPIALG
jgi:hypothetical protein